MASDVSTLKQCYNKGCGKKYSEDDDSEGTASLKINHYILHGKLHFFVEACIHHPGVPVFHDAMKVSFCLR